MAELDQNVASDDQKMAIEIEIFQWFRYVHLSYTKRGVIHARRRSAPKLAEAAGVGNSFTNWFEKKKGEEEH